MSGICSKHQGHDPNCPMCNAGLAEQQQKIAEQVETLVNSSKPEDNKDREKFDSCVMSRIKGSKGKKRAAIFSHAQPDLDAIGSQMGIRHLLETQYDIEVDLYTDGDVSHPQNKIAAQLLDPNLIPVVKYKPDAYSLNILVDTVPDNAGVGGHDIRFDIIIDHHKEIPDNSESVVVHHFSGSCAGIVHELLQAFDIKFNPENESHVKVATAILAGVFTDTSFCTKPDTTTRDFIAQQATFQIADSDMVRKIVKFRWPISWVKLLGKAIAEHELHDGLAVVGLGQLESDHFHAVAEIADQMLKWNNIHTAVVFGFFEGKYISGCLRTLDDTVEVAILCSELAGSYGSGGGKSQCGRFTKPLGAFEFEMDEPTEVLDRWWEIQRQREISKIVKVLSK